MRQGIGSFKKRYHPCPRGVYSPVGVRDNEQNRHYSIGVVVEDWAGQGGGKLPRVQGSGEASEESVHLSLEG